MKFCQPQSCELIVVNHVHILTSHSQNQYYGYSMRKFSSGIALFVTGTAYFVLSGHTFAQSICPPAGSQFANLCKLKLDNASSIVSSIVTLLLILAIVLALIFLIWGAIRWITSGGDKGKLDGARTAITASIVGLILAFLAYFILNVLTFLFTGKGLTAFEIPTIVPK